MDQLRHLLRQSFDTFQIYGKEPEALRNILGSFIAALKDIEIEFITDGFQSWLRSKSAFPTPADIRELAIEARNIAFSRKNSSIRYNGIVWTQIIRDRLTDEIIVEYHQGQHKSDVELTKILGSRRYRMSFRREVG